MDKKRTRQLSGTLSKVLRHKAIQFGYPMREDGYLNVNVLLAGLNKGRKQEYSLEEVEEIVRTCEKQRFRLVLEEGELLIRANQGHSMDISK